MSDNLQPEDRKRTMQAVKGKRTAVERRVFSMLAGLGLRGWRQNAIDVLGKPDVVFDRQHIAIFIDGCFWHGCPICKRKLPKTNRAYWARKINRNKQLARLNNRALRRGGWTVIRVWEHEIGGKQNLDRVRIKMTSLLVPAH